MSAARKTTADIARVQALNLLGGHPALDLVNTVDWRARFDGGEETLISYAALLFQATRCGLVAVPEARTLTQAAESRPEAAEEARKEAVGLRDAVFRLVVAALDQRKPTAADLARLNHWLGAADTPPRLMVAGQGYAFAPSGDDADLGLPLRRFAHQAGELLASTGLQRVRCCAGPDCGWLFLDKSPNRLRRWCSMEGCGNRAKAANFYHRHKN